MKISRRSLIKGILGAVCLGSLAKPTAAAVQRPVAKQWILPRVIEWEHKDYVLDTQTMYVKREAFMLEFFTYPTPEASHAHAQPPRRFEVVRRSLARCRAWLSRPVAA